MINDKFPLNSFSFRVYFLFAFSFVADNFWGRCDERAAIDISLQITHAPKGHTHLILWMGRWSRLRTTSMMSADVVWPFFHFIYLAVHICAFRFGNVEYFLHLQAMIYLMLWTLRGRSYHTPRFILRRRQDVRHA